MNSSLLEAKDFGENKRKESDGEGSELELYQLSDEQSHLMAGRSSAATL